MPPPFLGCIYDKNDTLALRRNHSCRTFAHHAQPGGWQQTPPQTTLTQSLHFRIYSCEMSAVVRPTCLFSHRCCASICTTYIRPQEWLRWPYASELPGSHMVAIAAVDEAGNVDPEPAVWTWSVDARPRTSLTSAPQVSLVLVGRGTFQAYNKK